MATTALIVEMIVIGIFALGWAVPLLEHPSILDHQLLANLAAGASPFSSLITVLIVAVAYQVGWLVDSVSRTLVNSLYGHRLRRRLFVNAVYRRARAEVYLRASPDYVAELRALRSTVRLSRSAIVNFIGLSVVLVVVCGSKIGGAGCVAGAVGSVFLWRNRLEKYYSTIRDAHSVLAR